MKSIKQTFNRLNPGLAEFVDFGLLVLILLIILNDDDRRKNRKHKKRQLQALAKPKPPFGPKPF